jgi:hypothetical protein
LIVFKLKTRTAIALEGVKGDDPSEIWLLTLTILFGIFNFANDDFEFVFVLDTNP